MTIYDSRIPVRLEKFQSSFSKLRTTAYLETPPGARTSSALSRIVALSWSPLGNYVATGAVDKKLRVWNPERAHVKHSTELRGHTGSVERVAFNPMREAELASCSLDGTVRIWDVRSKANVAEIKTGKECFSLCWRPDGTELVVGTKDDTIFRISRLTNTELSQHQQTIQTNYVAFSWSGNELFLTCGDGTLKVLDYPSMTVLHTLRAHTSSCFTVEMSPVGSVLGIGGTDALLTLWDTSSWYCVRSLSKMAGPVRSLSFSWDGGYVVAGGEEDKGLEISHVDSGEYVHKVDCGPAPIVQWSPKDYSLAYAVSGETVNTSGLRIINGASLV